MCVLFVDVVKNLKRSNFFNKFLAHPAHGNLSIYLTRDKNDKTYGYSVRSILSGETQALKVAVVLMKIIFKFAQAFIKKPF